MTNSSGRYRIPVALTVEPAAESLGGRLCWISGWYRRARNAAVCFAK